jgi:hypothetical protein
VVSQSAAEDARTQETAAHGRLAAAPSRKLTRTSPEKAFLSYSAPFATRIGPGGREERREAHQGLVDGSGAAETMCSGEERTGCRAHAEEGAPTLGCCLSASVCFPRNTCASNKGIARVKSGPTTTNCGGGIPAEEERRGSVRWGEGALGQQRARVSDVSREEKGRESQGHIHQRRGACTTGNGPAAGDFMAAACAQERGDAGMCTRVERAKQGLELGFCR